MEKLFKLQENGTTVKTELLAGLTTFMTMAYIIALNPNLLTNFAVGTPLWNGVFLATCIASAIGTICMAFMANKPFVMAPGMGLNSFFAVVVANIAVINNCEYESAFQTGLVIILVEGIVFLVLTLLKVREKIVEAIPLGVRYGIAPAIGLMLMNIGLGSNVGIYAEGNGFTSPFYIMRDFFGALTPSIIKGSMGDIGYHTMVLTAITAFLGVFMMVVLAKKGIKASVLLGMLFSSVLYWAGSFLFLGVNPFASLETASFVPPFADMVSTTLFKFDFAGFVNIGWFTAITLIITFCMIDMFDTIGTLVGTASRAGMVDKDGNMPKMKEALLSDAIGTIAGAATGTSTVTTFIESASGVEAGGRTGHHRAIQQTLRLLVSDLPHHRQLRQQYLLGTVQHFSLSGGQSPRRLPPHQGLDHPCHLRQVAAFQPRHVLPVAAVPVALLLHRQRWDGREHRVHPLPIVQQPHTDGLAVISGQLQYQSADGLTEHIVRPRRAVQQLLRHVLDNARPVHGVHHPLTDAVHTAASLPAVLVENYTVFPHFLQGISVSFPQKARSQAVPGTVLFRYLASYSALQARYIS